MAHFRWSFVLIAAFPVFVALGSTPDWGDDWEFEEFWQELGIQPEITLEGRAGGRGFPSLVTGTSIPNAKVISGDGHSGLVIRGQAPRNKKDLEDLKNNLNVNKVLIFKKRTSRGAVKKEVGQLKELDLRYKEISFPWKGFSSFNQGCRLMVEGLRYINEAAKKGDRVFLHCTYGEDRTGALAGLFYYLNTDRSLQEIFQEEMCDHGYEAGNPGKPQKVVEMIRGELTYLFLTMALMIEDGVLTNSKWMTREYCKIQKYNDIYEKYIRDGRLDSNYKCQ